jgi:hypothetical protein
MKYTKALSVLGVLLLAGLLAPGPILATESFPHSLLIADMDVTLEPGVWHGWEMKPSYECGGYLVEVTPLEPSVDGAHVERAVVQPEYNGFEWNDVLRVMIPDYQPPLNANVRVYNTCQFPVVMELEEVVLEAGAWMGWVVGPASMDRGYIVEVTPLEDSSDGAYVDRALVQAEYDGYEWNDVLRVMTPEGFGALKAQIRVYATPKMPVVARYEIDLQPGVWTGLPLRPSAVKGAYIVEVSPLGTAQEGAHVERAVVQPEFDGKHWNDVVRLQAPANQAGLKVEVRVYKWVR